METVTEISRSPFFGELFSFIPYFDLQVETTTETS